MCMGWVSNDNIGLTVCIVVLPYHCKMISGKLILVCRRIQIEFGLEHSKEVVMHTFSTSCVVHFGILFSGERIMQWANESECQMDAECFLLLSVRWFWGSMRWVQYASVHAVKWRRKLALSARSSSSVQCVLLCGDVLRSLVAWPVCIILCFNLFVDFRVEFCARFL